MAIPASNEGKILTDHSAEQGLWTVNGGIKYF